MAVQLDVHGEAELLRRDQYDVHHPVAGTPWLVSFGVVVILALAIGATLSVAFSLPVASQHLQAVFWKGGNLLNLFCFGVFIVGLGAGGGLLGNALRLTRLPWLLLPLLSFVVCLFAYLCLHFSVTPETLHNVVGSPLSTQPRLAGQLPAVLAPVGALATYSPDLAAGIERAVRFSALYAPLPLFTGLAIAAAADFPTGSSGGLRYLSVAAVVVLLLWLCKLIVIDFAATSNIVELIDPSPIGGFSRFYFANLAVLAVAMSAVGVWLALIGVLSGRSTFFLLIATVVASTGLILLSLDDSVEKYQFSFHALDFILTGQRNQPLSEGARMAVWAVIHLALCTTIAFGIWIVLPRSRLPDRGPSKSPSMAQSRH